MKKHLPRLAVIPVLLLLGACSQVTSRTAPNADLGGLKHIFVVHLLTDGRSVDRTIAQELRARGYDADYGPRTEMPDNADAAIVYQDNWNSDFTTYLLGIYIQVRTPRTDNILALANYSKPSVMGRDPSVAIDGALDKLFPVKRPALAPLPLVPDAPDLMH